MEPEDIAERVRNLVISHTMYRKHCINLIASENVSSPCVREIVASDLVHRYEELLDHQVNKRWGPGSGTGAAASYVIEIEKMLVDLVKDLFDANYVEYRPPGGQIAAHAAISAFVQQGDAVFELSEEDGGHGWSVNNPVKYKPCFYPFDSGEWNIDMDAAVKEVKKVKPKLLITGASFYLFPHPVRELKDAAEEVGATVVSDEAHVFGLVAGKQWPNALTEGADVLTGSTHKTVFGPLKGLALMNNQEIARKVSDHTYPGFLTCHHLNSTAALVIALAELLKFGETYAKQVVKNAKALAEALSSEGFKVIGEGKGFTECHQVLVDTLRCMPGAKAAEQLEKANIIVNGMKLSERFDGLRIGVSEVTRLGMKESEMKWIAELIKRVLMNEEVTESIVEDVVEFTCLFGDLHYSFNKGSRAYKFFRFW